MEPYTYDPIDLEGPAFRLLRLLKGEGPVIRCDIFQAWLHQPDEGIPYEALSYTWGIPEFSESLEVNGKRLGITTSLYLALHYLRYEDQDRILWVDAVCIDQNNLRERGHQVRQMGETYKQAQRVLFWLGQATYATNVLMDYLRELQSQSTKLACGGWMRSDKRWLDLWEAVTSTMRGTHADSRALLSDGLNTLLNRPWFTRVWILQEVANARAALVCCGTKSVQARIFALAPRLGDVPPPFHCQSVLDIMPGASRKDSWWGESRDLRTLLRKFSGSEAHDARDMIYALLGMSSDARDSDSLRPNYATSERDLVSCVISFLRSRGDKRSLAHSSTIRDFLRQFRPVSGTALNQSAAEGWLAGVTPILSADGEDDGAALNPLFMEASNIETRDLKGRTPLSRAAWEGRVAVVRKLLDNGADIETEEPKMNMTPLLRAIQGGHGAVVQLLLDKGANMEARDSHAHMTPLLWAVRESEGAMVRLLLENRAVVDARDHLGQSSLSWAAKMGHGAFTMLLLENGADIELKDEHGRTPLFWAAHRRDGATFRFLLDKGADINSQDHLGRTLLLWAVQEGAAAVVERLLENGADTELKEVQGRTPLAWVAKEGHEAMARLLIEKRADLECKDDHGLTPLLWAAQRGQRGIVELLLENGAHIESKDSLQQTPLIWAAQEGHDAIIKLLLAAGSNIESTDASGCTALVWAKRKGHVFIVRLLRQVGRSVASTNASRSRRI